MAGTALGTSHPRALLGETPYHGWEGDEDEGQMSAWYVMSAMGLFEMDGGCSAEPMVDLGSPLFEKITVRLDPDYYPGRTFTIEARNNSPENVYVQRAYLNGKRLPRPRIPFAAIAEGGTLLFEMRTDRARLLRGVIPTTRSARGAQSMHEACRMSGRPRPQRAKARKRAIQGRKNRTNNCIIKKDLLCLHI